MISEMWDRMLIYDIYIYYDINYVNIIVGIDMIKIITIRPMIIHENNNNNNKITKLHHRRPQTVAQVWHEILDKPRARTRHPLKDKLGDKTGDKRKTRPERQTQHPSQGGDITKALRTLRTPTVNCLGNNKIKIIVLVYIIIIKNIKKNNNNNNNSSNI